MAYLDSTRRVGRSQGASIFWGLVSVFFAAAACYYFWKNHENETSANVLRDQVLILREEGESLSSQKDKLQDGINETETQLRAREEFLQEKESKLAEEETRLETADQQQQSQSEKAQNQTAVVKKFNDTVRKLVKGDNPDIDVVLRGGRPVLRVPDSIFFAFGDTTLRPEGKAMLNQIVQALSGQLDNFELRVEAFTDTDGEIQKPDAAAAPPAKTDPNAKPAKPAPPAATKTHYANSWELTGARAAAILRFFRDQTDVPFQNVIVVGRGDFQPIIPNAKEGHARNRRIEITITPLPAPFHAADLARSTTDPGPAAPANPLDPPPDAAVAVKKDKAP